MNDKYDWFKPTLGGLELRLPSNTNFLSTIPLADIDAFIAAINKAHGACLAMRHMAAVEALQLLTRDEQESALQYARQLGVEIVVRRETET